MDNLIKKSAYIKGLCDGLEISEDTKEGKIIFAMIDLLEEVALQMQEIRESYEELDSFVESIDDAVLELEEVIFDECEDDCTCHNDDEDGYIELECPNCSDKIFLDEGMFEDGEEISCPNCDELIDFESSCGGCDCSCEETTKE